MNSVTQTIIASGVGEGAAYPIFLSVLEVTLVLVIVWLAWNWPRRATPPVRETRTQP